MIEIKNISKSFADILAVDRVSVNMKEDTVFGLIGTNGAGKSTVLRMVAGVLKADEGSITVDGLPVFDNVEAKKKIFFISDEPYFFANSNAAEMEKYFSTVYEEFRKDDYYRYLDSFGLDKKRKINTFSKKMTLTRNETPEKQFRECRDRCCTMLRDGKLHPCYLPATIPIFNNRFGTKISGDNSAIDIYESGITGQEILEQLRNNFEICQYCTCDEVYPWEQTKNVCIEDWIIE